jgi:hypothetical protein
MNAEKLLPLIGLAFILGHIVSGEHSPVRMFMMRIFARYIEAYTASGA